MEQEGLSSIGSAHEWRAHPLHPKLLVRRTSPRYSLTMGKIAIIRADVALAMQRPAGMFTMFRKGL